MTVHQIASSNRGHVHKFCYRGLPVADFAPNRTDRHGSNAAVVFSDLALPCPGQSAGQLYLTPFFPSLAQHRVFRKPYERVQDHARQIDDLDLRASRAVRYLLERSRGRLRGMTGRLESLSPLGVLERGYSLTWRTSDEALATDAAELEVGQSITTRLARGTLISSVERISTSDD